MGSRLVVARALMRSAMVLTASCSRSRLDLKVPAAGVGTSAPAPPVGGHAAAAVGLWLRGAGTTAVGTTILLGKGLRAGARGRGPLESLLLTVGGGDEVADALDRKSVV